MEDIRTIQFIESMEAELALAGESELLSTLRYHLSCLAITPLCAQTRLRAAFVQLKLGRREEALVLCAAVIQHWIRTGQAEAAAALCEHLERKFPRVAQFNHLRAALIAHVSSRRVGGVRSKRQPPPLPNRRTAIAPARESVGLTSKCVHNTDVRRTPCEGPTTLAQVLTLAPRPDLSAIK